MTRLLCMRLGTGHPAQPSLPAYCETGRPVLRRTCGLAPGEGHVGGEWARLDDNVMDGSAVAEDAMPLVQCPIHRGAAIEADVEPLVKPAHQGRAELAPLAGLV